MASPIPSASPTTLVSPTAPVRIGVSDGPIDASVGPLIVFQLPGDDHLRGVTWDGEHSGVLGGRPLSPAWTQSPDGSRYVVGGVVYGATGVAIGNVPWNERKSTFSWSARGDLLCASLPNEPGATGAMMRLEVGGPGQQPRTVASGFTIFGDNAGYPILACDPQSDRAIVGVFGQGLFAGRLYVFRLSSGELLREQDAPPGVAGAWAATSSDGAFIAHAIHATMNSSPITVISRADDGTVLATLPDFEVHGFSGNGAMVYGAGPSKSRRFEVRDWRSGRTIWSASGYSYGSFLPQPDGDRLAVAVGSENTLADADVYVMSPAGVAWVSPHGLKTSFRY